MAEQRVAQLKAEADATEETAKRLAAQLEDERQQDERGQCMVEEISELLPARVARQAVAPPLPTTTTN
mgnify:CR=1 FL=1